MYLERLDVSGIRNLEYQQLRFGRSLNIIYGDNGSGKTSLLESIHLLGRGRSFRTSHLSSVINHKVKACVVSGRLVSNDGQNISLGVSRDSEGGFQIRRDGNPVYSAAELATELPLLLINSNSFSLLEGGSGNRRRYLDWSVFHVEHAVQHPWKKLTSVLKQRNSLLRRGKIDRAEMAYWDRELASIAGRVHKSREQLFLKLSPLITGYMEKLGGVPGIDYQYRAGWDVTVPLLDQLDKGRDQELRSGRTLLGPHRADIKVQYKGSPAWEILSRGQLKVLVAAMYLAQARLLADAGGIVPIVLVDDLPAELDKEHIRLVIASLVSMGTQLFVTGVSIESILGLLPREVIPDTDVFHVEHGTFVKQEIE